MLQAKHSVETVKARTALLSAQGNPDQMITFYRGMPATSLVVHRGDWVITSAELAWFYASMGEDHVVTVTVRASSPFYAGFGSSEWGYDGDADLIGTHFEVSEPKEI